nr:DNA recombination protein RmuC [Actinomycetota bacterium]
RAHLAADGRQLRSHVDALAKKEYWQRVHPSPEFVVAFVPGDPLLTTALEQDPGLMEHAVANNVLLATPTTLIALLRAVAYGWQNDALSENARDVQRLGAELYRRLSVFGDHLASVGRSLDGAVGSYNRAVGSLEGRVLVTARRFSELGVVGTAEKALASPTPVDTAVRHLHAPELAGGSPPEEVRGPGPATTGLDGTEPAPPAYPS